MTSPLRATSPEPLVNVPLPAISIFLPEATVTSPLRATSPVPVVNVPLPCIRMSLPEATVTSPLRATSPAKVADKSDAKVKIISSIGFKLLPLFPAVAD